MSIYVTNSAPSRSSNPLDETKATNNAPLEGRNQRRTLLVTGGKLGGRPDRLRDGYSRNQRNTFSQVFSLQPGKVWICLLS